MLTLTAWHEPAGGREPQQLGGLHRLHSERLIAHDVLASGERGADLFGVQVVRRAEVDDVDALVGQHRVEAR
jgi:hypothetical protein